MVDLGCHYIGSQKEREREKKIYMDFCRLSIYLDRLSQIESGLSIEVRIKIFPPVL